MKRSDLEHIIRVAAGITGAAFVDGPKMKATEEQAFEDLARFVQVIGADKALRERFCHLATLSPTQRSKEIHVMAEQMNAGNKDRELVSVFRLFADTRVFEAAMVALRDAGYVRT